MQGGVPIKFDGPGPVGYRFDWAWSGLGLMFIGLGWAGLRILEPIANTASDAKVSYVGSNGLYHRNLCLNL